MFPNARLEVRRAGALDTTSVDGSGIYSCGPLDVELTAAESGFSWSAVVSGNRPVEIESVALVWDAGRAGDRSAAFVNGYQSWSRSGSVLLAEAGDPSRAPGSFDLTRGMYHADAAIAGEGEVRSELVTVIDPDAGGPLLRVGFDAATTHDGTLRIRRKEGEIEVRADAYLGGARLQPGETRALHAVGLSAGDSAAVLLEEWAARAGEINAARTSAAYQVGWCSWYHYFHELSGTAVKDNLSLSVDWPFETFQIDDGYERHIGDWLATNERFNDGLDVLAAAIDATGMRPGIWIAPFLASPESDFATQNPEMLAGSIGADTPLVGMVNPVWGGVTHVLDTSRRETLEHLERVASDLVSAGFRYLKIDFAYAPSIPGRYADPSLTPAQRVRAGLEAIRRGAGDEVFILGCGCPLGPAIGVVDGMRIGPDVAPYWMPGPEHFVPPGYEQEVPSTLNAWRNTLARSFMHRRLWLNDPDCLMLRTKQTDLTPDAVRAWALAVAASGGLAIVSDDLSLLDDRSKDLFDEVLAVGREVDETSRLGAPPRCEELMQADTPARLTSGSFRLVGDLRTPSAKLLK